MVLCAARTGSTLLVHLLRSHPSVMCYGELFSPGQVTGAAGVHRGRARQDPGYLRALTAHRDDDPVRFLYKIAFDPQGHDSVGFKVKYDELVLPSHRRLLRALRRDRDIRVVLLRRRNLFERYVSWYTVNEVTHQTLAVGDDEVAEAPPVSLDPVKVELDMRETTQRQARFAQMFSDHRTFGITYEELHDESAHGALLEFLGVAPAPLNSPTKKLQRRTMEQAVANFDELKDHFEGTPFERHFAA